MQEKHIAVFVDYDNIEIGVKSTLQRDFKVDLVLDALKERGHLVAKFAYANWGRQDQATRQMAENAVQMVQRVPSPRGDKNAADINLALDALEMAFTHGHVNAFAIVSGDSDFIPLVNKLREYGKTVFIVGGKAFTSTILQQNCHEFISYESLLDDASPRDRGQRVDRDRDRAGAGAGAGRPPREDRKPDHQRQRPAPLDLERAMPLVQRALEVLERRAVQPQLGLLKSTMLQLSPTFNEKAFGARSFSEFVEKLDAAEYVKVTGSGGRYIIEQRSTHPTKQPLSKPEDALTFVRDVLETHRLDLEDGGSPIADVEGWMKEEAPDFDWKKYGFQEFAELINFAQDRLVTRTETSEEHGLVVYLGAEFYPPAPPEKPEPSEQAEEEEEEDEPQPIVKGQPSYLEPNAKPVSPRARKRRSPDGAKPSAKRTRRRKAPDSVTTP